MNMVEYDSDHSDDEGDIYVAEFVWPFMTHKYMGPIVAFSISKNVKPNQEQKEMTSGFQQGNVCKC